MVRGDARRTRYNGGVAGKAPAAKREDPLAERVALVLRGELPEDEALAVLREVQAKPEKSRTKDEVLLVYRSRFAY